MRASRRGSPFGVVREVAILPTRSKGRGGPIDGAHPPPRDRSPAGEGGELDLESAKRSGGAGAVEGCHRLLLGEGIDPLVEERVVVLVGGDVRRTTDARARGS